MSATPARPASQPTPDAALAAAMHAQPAPAEVDRNAQPVDLSGLSMVCGCGKPWLHEDRCARCAARRGDLFCGLANNHRGRHQAIAVWS